MFRRINKRLLKEDTEFYDYKTAPVDLSKGDVIDTTKVGMSYYDDYLTKEGQKYLYDKTGTVGKIVTMSPQKYYEECATKIFNTSVDKLKRSRYAEEETLSHLKNVLTKYGKKFPLPFLNYADHQQEGLHRMAVIGDMFGWDHEVPVLIVDYKSKEDEKRIKKQEHDNEVGREIRDTVNRALEYRYDNIYDIEDELEYRFEDKNFSVEFTKNEFGEEEFTVTRDGVSETYPVSRIRVAKAPPDDEWRKDIDSTKDDFDLEDDLDWRDILSDVDIDKMSPKEFDDYLKDLAKK